MKLVRSIIAVSFALSLVGCGGAGSALTGPEATERGEAHAINPARNVTVVCEGTTKNTNAGVTVNITNNCTKNNTEGVAPEGTEG